MTRTERQGSVFTGALDRLSLWWAAIGAAAIFGMMIMMVADAIGRKVVGSVPGAFETSRAFLALAMFLPQGYAQMRRAHVSVELLTMHLPQNAQTILEGIGALLGVGVFSVLIWAGWIKAWEATLDGEMWFGIVDYPIWPIRWFIPLGAGLLTLQLLNTAIHSFRRIIRKQ